MYTANVKNVRYVLNECKSSIELNISKIDVIDKKYALVIL